MSDDSFNDDPFEKEQMIKTMLKSIQDMPTGFRTVLNLYVIEGHSHDQIANLLGISVGTSKSQLFRAKEYLRKVLANALNVNE
jgi:RNA polymerase sigma-70 factor (ECF subfamily)